VSSIIIGDLDWLLDSTFGHAKGLATGFAFTHALRQM